MEQQRKLLDSFYEQAVALVERRPASAATTRELLAPLAERLGLSAEDFNRALAVFDGLSAGSTEVDAARLERREHFRNHVRRSLARSAASVIAVPTQERLREAGEHCYGVGTEAIARTIQEVALEMSMRLVSLEQGHDHLVNCIRARLAAGLPLLVPSDERSRLFAEGLEWGVEPPQVAALLSAEVDRLAGAQRRARWRDGLRIGLIVLVLLACAVLFAWLLAIARQ